MLAICRRKRSAIHSASYGEETRLAVAYKKRSRQHENRFVVDSYFYSEWQNKDEWSLDLLKGLTLKAVYENLIKSLISVSPGSCLTLEQAVEKQKVIEKLEREIGALESKIAKERQFNRKVKYNLELQEKRKELEKIW